MSKSLIVLALLVSVSAAARTDAASTNAVQSAGHSVAAANFGSVALAESAASVVAVPLLVSGAAMVVSSAAITEVGSGSLQADTEILQPQVASTTITANGPPALN